MRLSRNYAAFKKKGRTMGNKTKHTETNVIPAGIISEASRKEINATISNLTKTNGVDKGFHLEQVNAAAQHIVSVLVAEADGADGKFDHKIQKKTLVEKLNKIEEIPGIGKLMNGEFAQILVSSHAMLKDMPKTFPSGDIEKNLKVSVDRMVNKAAIFDTNGDKFISPDEMKAVFQKLELQHKIEDAFEHGLKSGNKPKQANPTRTITG